MVRAWTTLLSKRHVFKRFTFWKLKTYPQTYPHFKIHPLDFVINWLNFNQPRAPLNGSVLTVDNSKTKTNTNANHPTPKQKNQWLKACKVHGWIKARPWKPYKQWVSKTPFLPTFKIVHFNRSISLTNREYKNKKPIKFTVGCTPRHANPRQDWEKHKPSKVHGCIDATPRKATTAKGLRFCFFYLPCFPDLYFLIEQLEQLEQIAVSHDSKGFRCSNMCFW